MTPAAIALVAEFESAAKSVQVAEAELRPADAHWSDQLTTGTAVGPVFAAWIAAEAYRDRAV